MIEFFLTFCFFVMITACFAEWYKKRLRGYVDSEGKIKTKASRWEVRGITFAFSAVMAVCLTISNSLGMGLLAIIPYTFGIWLMQYFVSMKMIKIFINNLVENMSGD